MANAKIKTLEDWLTALDASVRDAPSPYAAYGSYSLLLHIWFEGKGIPAPEYNPNNSPELRPLYAFAKRIGRPMLDAVRARELAAWKAENPTFVEEMV